MKSVIGLSIVLVVIGLSMQNCSYLKKQTKKHSPEDTVSAVLGDIETQVTYCRPSQKGRLVFGTEEDDALQPFGEYWRMGANETSEITFSKDVIFGGESVAAGTYRIYAYPGKEVFTIVLNTEIDSWGARPPGEENDVVKVQVPSIPLDPNVEQFKIKLNPANDTLWLRGEWAEFGFRVPITAP